MNATIEKLKRAADLSVADHIFCEHLDTPLEWEGIGSLPPEVTQKEERKIIQISAAGVEQYHAQLYALCNDGTVWTTFGSNSRWNQIPPIPQDKEIN